MPTLPLPVSTSCQPNPCAPGGQCSPRSARTALVRRAPAGVRRLQDALPAAPMIMSRYDAINRRHAENKASCLHRSSR